MGCTAWTLTLGVNGGRNFLDLKYLTCVILHPREDDERDARPLLLDDREDIFRAERVFALARLEFDDGFVRVVPA